jgi:alpha-galactosidase
MTGALQREIAVLPVDPARACVYAEGWQSWSVTGQVLAASEPYRVTAANSLAIDCQYRLAAPPGVHQGSGLLAVDPGDGGPVCVVGARSATSVVPLVRAALHGDRLVITADQPVDCQGDPGPGGIGGALARWGTRFAASAGVVPGGLRPLPTVWCSWYQYYGDVSADAVVANLAAMDEHDVPVDVVQIDDGYASTPGDWLDHSSRFPDLPALVGRIRDSGRRAGIWIAPLLAGYQSNLYRAHPDWVVTHDGSSEPVWAGDVCRQHCAALDITRPDVADYLSQVLATMRGWGIDYFKVDFMYAGGYEGRRHQHVTGVEAYRQALGLIRQAIGPEPALLACGAPILPSVGLVDAMRVGPDIAERYEPADGNPSMPSQRNATRNTVARAWQHGRFWVNDPDCLIARPGVERREDWAAVVDKFGGLRASSDAIALLDDWGLETTRRILVPSPVSPFF